MTALCVAARPGQTKQNLSAGIAATAPRRLYWIKLLPQPL